MYILQIQHLTSIWRPEKLVKQLGLMQNETAVIDYIYQDAKEADLKKFNVLVYTPPVYDYQWQYLFRWYGNKKYGYVPSSEAKDIFYLIIEPDPEQPWRIDGWLKTVIGVGATIDKKQFPDGIIVEKRSS